MSRVYVKDYAIQRYRTGSQLRGHENECAYKVVRADTGEDIKRGFGRREDARRWLSKTVRIANTLIAQRG